MKATPYEEFRDSELRDGGVREAYEAFGAEFTLAREVLELRTEHNLTQKELAERIGTSQPAIARIESGNYRNASLAFIRRLAEALDAEAVIHLRKRGA